MQSELARESAWKNSEVRINVEGYASHEIKTLVCVCISKAVLFTHIKYKQLLYILHPERAEYTSMNSFCVCLVLCLMLFVCWLGK